MVVRVARRGEPLPISVLSQRSGVSIATIKYYIREGLIRSGQDLEADDAETIDQLRLIRGLVHVVGLSIRQVRQVLELVRDPTQSPAALMTGVTVMLPLAGARDAPAADLAEARATLARAGFDQLPDAPYVNQLLAAIALADECGVGMDAEHLDAYARAARECAEADFNCLPLDSPSQAARAAVLGTAIYDPILLGLRRLAHRELADRLPASAPMRERSVCHAE
ncbi:MAG: MerR family transcriptional regulator [Propionibacteriaceae bacterium]|nr:MerR family transcriptional regulator [Propionibacteriaceae bacterium]